jgi:mannosyltransferase OCH1-like enzyme
MIPKKIHYIHLGNGAPSPLLRRCIGSFHKYCPDFEIKKWSESNFDIGESRFAREAYSKKKYAFTSDYMRLKILENEGGIYMDTDMELYRPLNGFLGNKAFVGFYGCADMIGGSIIGAEGGHPFIRELLNEYGEREYDSTMIEKNITRALVAKYPDFKLNDTKQSLGNITVYPSDVFYETTYPNKEQKRTRNTVSNHHFVGSWKQN